MPRSTTPGVTISKLDISEQQREMARTSREKKDREFTLQRQNGSAGSPSTSSPESSPEVVFVRYVVPVPSEQRDVLGPIRTRNRACFSACNRIPSSAPSRSPPSVSSGRENTQECSVPSHCNQQIRGRGDDDEQSTSNGSSFERAEVPVPNWGDCCICFEKPVEPRGCNRCRQLIGCRSCVDNWHYIAQDNSSCPLCRTKWFRRPEVGSMADIDRRYRLSRRRAQYS